MAEYIDRTELECDTEWSDYYDDFISYSKLQIDSLPTADVVEREEYEFIRHQLSETMDRVAELDKLNGELRSRIDKAIEEMKALADPKNTILGFDEKMGLKTAMSILVRNIGD